MGAVALVAGLVYVWLAAQRKKACWYFGILSCAIIAYEDITRYHLFADAVLQIIYVVLGFWGLYHWGKNNHHVVVRKVKGIHHFFIIIITLISSVALGWVIDTYTEANMPFLDVWTTMLSLVATVLLVWEQRVNWLYWIVANALYIYIYGSQGAWYYALLLFIYWLMAIYGWIAWGKRSRLASP